MYLIHPATFSAETPSFLILLYCFLENTPILIVWAPQLHCMWYLEHEQLWFSQILSFFFLYSYVVLMPKKRQALVEYEDMSGSCNAVTYANDNQIYIAGNPAYVNYSTSQKISRPGDSDDSRSVNNVLLFTIMNPIYPITTVILSSTL